MNRTTALEFYIGLVEGKNVDALGDTLGVHEVELISLFKKTLKQRTLDNFQKYLACQCCRNWHCRFQINSIDTEIPIRQTRSKCTLSNENVLHALIECYCIIELLNYVQQLLLEPGIGRVHSEGRSTALHLFGKSYKVSLSDRQGPDRQGLIMGQVERTEDRDFSLRSAHHHLFQIPLGK